MEPTTVCNLCDDPASIDNSPEVERVFSNVRQFCHESFTVWRCKNCGSLHSKEAVHLPNYYSDYWMKRMKAGYFSNRIHGNRLRRLRARGLSPGHKILDYGCGEGQFIDSLKDHGFSNVSGYDPYSSEYATPDGLSQSYDVVTAHDVIEHVDDPKQLMSQLSDLLVPGGLLIIGTPNAAEIHLKPDPPTHLHQPYHRHILTEVVLKEIGTRALLQPIKTYHRMDVDTLWPGVNMQFLCSYEKAAGNYKDVLVEKPKLGLVLTSPALLLKFFAGYFLRDPGNMVVIFRKEDTHRSQWRNDSSMDRV
jgi:2-polyprenyl-3-methyl-5-hydroxy-6-metoxy-1,4-benzoquinol methylase